MSSQHLQDCSFGKASKHLITRCWVRREPLTTWSYFGERWSSILLSMGLWAPYKLRLTMVSTYVVSGGFMTGNRSHLKTIARKFLLWELRVNWKGKYKQKPIVSGNTDTRMIVQNEHTSCNTPYPKTNAYPIMLPLSVASSGISRSLKVVCHKTVQWSYKLIHNPRKISFGAVMR